MSTTYASEVHHQVENRPFTVGLTGGMAAGKSTALALFNDAHIETWSADTVAHALMHPDGLAYPAIHAHFGPEILATDGQIDRALLRKKIVQQPQEKAWLEDYLHPLVRSALQAAIVQARSPYVVVEIPLLTESRHAYRWLDRILLIDAEEAQQKQRAAQRETWTPHDIEAILQQQASRQARQKIADDIILNTQDLKQLELAVKHRHNAYLHMARTGRRQSKLG